MKYFTPFLLMCTCIVFILFYPYNVTKKSSSFIEQVYIKDKAGAYQIYSQYKGEILEKYNIKIKVKKQNIKNQKTYLEVFDINNEIIKQNQTFFNSQESLFIELSSFSSDEIFLEYTNLKNKKVDFDYNIYNSIEYNFFYKNEQLLFGLCYGIMFCSFLYYGIIFLTSKEKSFLYYSLMQFFVICTLVSFKNHGSYSPSEQSLLDIFENLSFIFTLLFAQSVLYIKEKHKQINKFLDFIIYLHFVDLVLILIFKVSILYLYIPIFTAFIIPVFLAIHVYLLGNKSALIYLLGWSLIFISIFFYSNKIFLIDTLYLLHIVMPLESLILSFALGIKLKKVISEKNENEQLLIHSLKLATTGEMINNIAHQWKQPLNHISFISMDLGLSNEDKDLSKEYLGKKLEEIDIQIDFMANTIDTFSDFYLNKKKKSFFCIKECVQNSLFILDSLIKANNIKIDFSFVQYKKIHGFENEYAQVILNIISNSKDAFIKNTIKKPEIKIEIYKKDEKFITRISDNAGGIKENEIHKIFDSYYTSKKQGSGIGLYMSKMIINKHFKGEIRAYNENAGACFEIVI